MALYILFFLLFLIPSLLEGIGIWVDHRIFLLYFSSIPILFYFYLSTFLKSITIPLKTSILYIFFLLFMTISTFFFSVDKQTSFELLLFYYSSFLLFIFFYNYKKGGKWLSYSFPIVLGIIFTIYSYLLPFFKLKGLHFLLPIGEKQFVFASYVNHNHLGDFLGLFLIILCWYGLQKKWSLLPIFLFFLTIFISSFSRSAYLSFFIVILMMLFYNRNKLSSLILPLVFLLLSSVIFATYMLSIQQPKNSPFYSLQQYGKTTFHMIPRDVLSARDIFIKQALLSIQKSPLFGIGGGNFIVASRNNILNNAQSDSAHNIFFELATEQGLLATFCFILFIFLISKCVLFTPTLPGFLFLYLLFNFQTDYTYQVYSLFLFWIILSSLTFTEKRHISLLPALYGLLCLIPIFILASISTSVHLAKMGDYRNAIKWYPFNKGVYASAIKQSDDQVNIYIRQTEYIAPYDVNINTVIAAYYLQNGDKQKALQYYERIYDNNHLCSFHFIKQIY
ncbi:MAG: O-antigen ligase family protein, partial [Candidatus Roizmanbacteria bacterium]|nr:O-antigen ligase family protein [Candidatus Roizmanbacteria bacterium]